MAVSNVMWMSTYVPRYVTQISTNVVLGNTNACAYLQGMIGQTIDTVFK